MRKGRRVRCVRGTEGSRSGLGPVRASRAVQHRPGALKTRARTSRRRQADAPSTPPACVPTGRIPESCVLVTLYIFAFVMRGGLITSFLM